MHCEVASSSYLNRIGIHKRGVRGCPLGKKARNEVNGEWVGAGEAEKWGRGGEEEDRQGEDGKVDPCHYKTPTFSVAPIVFR